MELKIGNEVLEVDYTFENGDPGSREVAPSQPIVEINKITYKGVEIDAIIEEIAPDFHTTVIEKILQNEGVLL